MFNETTEKNVMPSDRLWEDFNKMIEQGIRGNKRGKVNQLRIMTEIKELLSDKDDYEIMMILGIQILLTIDTNHRSIKKIENYGIK
jgi:hypothetical protein